MTIQWWQILLLTLYAGFAFYDGNNTTFGTVKPTMAGFLQVWFWEMCRPALS